MAHLFALRWHDENLFVGSIPSVASIGVFRVVPFHIGGASVVPFVERKSNRVARFG